MQYGSILRVVQTVCRTTTTHYCFWSWPWSSKSAACLDEPQHSNCRLACRVCSLRVHLCCSCKRRDPAVGTNKVRHMLHMHACLATGVPAVVYSSVQETRAHRNEHAPSNFFDQYCLTHACLFNSSPPFVSLQRLTH